MDLSQVPLEELMALRQRMAPPPPAEGAPAPPQAAPAPDLSSLPLEQLIALRQRALAPQGPIREGDWQGLADRIQEAGAAVTSTEMGPPTPERAQAQRLAEARRQGEAYGQGRGAGETGFRQFANTIGVGLPAYLEAATSGLGTGSSVAERHEFVKSADAARGRTNPMTNLAATGAGAVVQGLALPIAPAASAGGRILQSGAVGAGTAGAQGLVESRGDVSQGALQAGIGGAAGLAGGALVEKVVTPAARAVSDRVAGVVQPSQDRAATVAARAFHADGQDTAAVRQFLAQNPEAVLADAGGSNVRSVMRAASNLSPFEGHGAISRTLDDRAAREAGSLRQALEAFGGSGRSAAQQQAAIKSEVQPITSRLYQEAYRQTPRVDDPALAQFAGTDVGRKAIQEAMRMARIEHAARTAAGEQLAPVTFPFRQNADGVMEAVPGVGMGLQAWDYVRRAVSDMERGAAPGSNLQRMYGDVARSLNKRLDEISPLYSQARGSAAEAFGARDAVEAGALSMRRGADVRDIADAAVRLPSDQAAQFRQGQAAELGRILSGAERVPSEGGTRSLSRQIMTPDTMRRLEASGGDVGDLTRTVDFWNRAADTRRAMGNSSTARQLAATAAITGAPVGYSAYQNGGMPDPRAVALSAALLGGRQAMVARQDKVGQELARLLMSRGGVPAEKTMTGMPPELLGRLLMMTTGTTAGAATSYANSQR